MVHHGVVAVTTLPELPGSAEQPAAPAPPPPAPAPAPRTQQQAPAPAPEPAPTTRSPLAAALALGVRGDPEVEARAQRIAAERNLPLAAVRSVLLKGTPTERAAIETDYDGELAGLERTRRWLATQRNRELTHDDIRTLARASRSLEKLRKPRGLFDEALSRTAGGFVQLQASGGHLLAALGGDPEFAASLIAAAHRDLQEREAGTGAATYRFRQEFGQAEGLDIVTTALGSPRQLGILVAGNLGFSALPLLAGAAGTPLGPLGVAGGVTAGGALTEFGAWVDGQLVEAGYDLTRESEVLRAYRDPELIARIQAEAVRKGLGTGVVDGISAFFGGSVVRKATGLRRVAAAGKELAIQSAAEAAGEAVGQIAATGEADIDEAIREGVASLGRSAVEIILGAASRAGPAATRAARKTLTARQAREAAGEAVEGARASKLQQRSPEGAEAHADAVLAEEDGAKGAVVLSRDELEAHYVAQDRNPVAGLREDFGERAVAAYTESAETGHVELPGGLFFSKLADHPELEPLLDVVRFGEDNLSALEGQQLEAAIEAQVGAATEGARLYQGRKEAQDRLDEVTAEIAALEEAGVEVGANTPVSAPGAEKVPGKVSGDGTDSAGLQALYAEQQALTEQLQQVREIEERTATTAATLGQTVAQQLVAAGRDKRSAETSAELIVAAFSTLSERSGVPLEQLVERFPVRVQRATGGAPQGTRLGQGNRGFIDIGEPGEGGRREFIINLMSKADRSTFLHESAHAFLEMFGDLAAETPGLQTDYQTLLDWLGVESREQIGVEQHEQFARGFEQYLREGRAPSAGLYRIFAAFRDWLTRLYRTALALDVELTDDVRHVMDRLLATDAEIDAVDYFARAAPVPEEVLAALTPEQRAEYEEVLRRTDDGATAALDRAQMEDLRRQRAALRSQRMAQLVAEAEAEIIARPAGQALSSAGESPIARASALELLPPEAVARLDALGILADDGVDFAAYLEDYGLGAPLEAVATLERAADPLPEARKLARQRREAEMRATGQLLNPREAQAIAREAQTQRDRADLAETKLRIYREAQQRAETGQRAERAEAAREQAAARREAFDRIPTRREIAARAERRLARAPRNSYAPHRFLSAAKRESTAAAARARVGDFEGAARHTEYERVNIELHRISSRLRRRDARRERALKRLAKGFRKKNPSEAAKQLTRYRGASRHVLAILHRFGLAEVEEWRRQPSQSLADWVRARDAEGLTLAVPDFLLAERVEQDHHELTSDQFEELYQFIAGVQHLAREDGKALTGDRRQTHAERSAEMIAHLDAEFGDKIVRTLDGALTTGEKFQKWARDFTSDNTKPSYLLRMLDGDKDGGPFTGYFFRELSRRADSSARRVRKYQERLIELKKKHFTEDELALLANTAKSRRDYAGVTRSYEERLGFLGHYGNVEGRQRLEAEYTPQQIQAMLAASSRADLEYVKARAQVLAEPFPEMVSQNERIAGQAVKPVEALPFTVTLADGEVVDMPGGYYPIDYKDTATKPGRQMTDAEAMGEVKRGSSAIAALHTGAFKQRAEVVKGGKLRLDESVVVSHLTKTLHTLEVREAVLDVAALLRNDELMEAIEKRAGTESVKLLGKWLTRVAAGPLPAIDAMDKASLYLRRGAVVSLIGMRLKTAAMQIFGFRQTAIRIGYGAAWRGVLRVASDLPGAHEFAQSKSKLMGERYEAQSWQRERVELGQEMIKRKLSWVERGAFYLVGRVQYLVDLATWYGQYEKTVSEMPAGADPLAWEDEAVFRADTAVRDSQSSGFPIDMSQIEDSGPVWRLFTTFFTEASLKLNQTRLIKSRTVWNDPVSVAKFLGDMFVLYFFEAAAIGIIAAASGDDDAEEDFVRRSLAALVDTYPFLREFSGPIKGYPYRGPAGLVAFGQGTAAIQQIGQGEADAAAARSLIKFSGSLLALPTSAVLEYADAIGLVLDGEIAAGLGRAVGVRVEE